MEYVKGSGGIFMDMTIHDFDMARYLSGSEVTEVYASGACLVNPQFARYGDVDTAIITLKFANGAIGVIDNCRHAPYGYDQRILWRTVPLSARAPAWSLQSPPGFSWKDTTMPLWKRKKLLRTPCRRMKIRPSPAGTAWNRCGSRRRLKNL